MKRTATLVIAGALASVTLLAATAASGPSGASLDSAKATRHAPREAATIPPGTVLRVGEQLKNLSTVLSLGHQNQNFPYQVQYSEFVGGPPMLQAFEGGALDVGFIQSTPLIFAQAANQHVYGHRRAGRPAEARTPWSRPRAALHQVLGRSEGQAGRLPAGHRLRVGAARRPQVGRSEPLTTSRRSTSRRRRSPPRSRAARPTPASRWSRSSSAYLQANPTAQVIAQPAAVTEKSDFLVATSSAAGEQGHLRRPSPTTSPGSSRRTSTWPPTPRRSSRRSTRASTASRRPEPPTSPSWSAPSKFFALPGAILGAQQNLANLYLAAGAVPGHVSVTPEFDAALQLARHDRAGVVTISLTRTTVADAAAGRGRRAVGRRSRTRLRRWCGSRRRRRDRPPAGASAVPPDRAASSVSPSCSPSGSWRRSSAGSSPRTSPRRPPYSRPARTSSPTARCRPRCGPRSSGSSGAWPSASRSAPPLRSPPA